MINSLRLAGAKGTYAAELPIWDKTLKFAPGLTLIVGGNGTGKSTILKILGAITILDGVSSGVAGGIPGLLSVRAPDSQVAAWPGAQMTAHLVRERLSLSVDAPLPVVKLDWDRAPVTSFSADNASRSPAYLGETGDMGAEIQAMHDKRSLSSGQNIMASLGRAISGGAAARVPTFGPKAIKSVNSLWSARAEAWNRWIGELPTVSTSRTILMDEPDQSLSPIAQVRLWEQIVALSSVHAVQIIAVSHSLFALGYGTILETQEGYAAEVRAATIKTAALLSALPQPSTKPKQKSGPEGPPEPLA